ncbi:circadian clock-controlled protein daywake-like [Leptidea sinapis]|uniref:circadian clock-controlled protein daywake-like n=1 Tax=Leptidea sinapis TaxID=189913 RepID=UPI0021322B8C|nr:circadian clock-controlled protein daywake-like [Leptidea sinapis]
MRRLSLLFVFIAAFVYVKAGDEEYLPSYIQPCDLQTPEFKECVRKQLVNSLPLFAKGIPEMGVPSIDPTELDNIDIDGSGLKLSFKKPKLHGLSHASLTELAVTIGELEEKFKLGLKMNLSLTGEYIADGKILILPIKGKGPSLIKVSNVDVEIISKLTHVKEGKGEYFKLATPNYKYEIESTTFDFKNLFEGNKQLAETTLKFANENWRQLMDDLAPPVIKQIVKTIVKAINKFFSKVTVQRLVKGYKSKA